MKFTRLFFFLIIAISLTIGSVSVYGQGIGNNLAFQGFVNPNSMNGVKARAMGNAFTAVSGDLSSLFYNPAGVAGINGIQFSFSAGGRNLKTFERQQFVPVGGKYGIMELIWAGIYTPQLADDGIRSDDIDYDLENHFTIPDSAVDFFDENSADWVEKNNSSGLNNMILAVPFSAFDMKFVASGAYSNDAIYDFDRNEHVLGTDFGPGRTIADSNWYVYNRKRSGNSSTFTAAIASSIYENLDVGLSFEYMSGETDDELSNEIFAHMQIQDWQNDNRELPANTYYFWHDSLTYGVSGKSNFNSFKMGIGAIYKSDKVTFGLRINLPYTLKRTFDYQEYRTKSFLRDTTAIPVTEQGNLVKGTSKLKAPLTLAFGFTIKPTDFIMLSIDYRFNPFSNSSYDLASYDSTNSSWALPKINSFQEGLSKWALPDMNSFHIGLEIIPVKYVSLLAGYSNLTEALRAEDHFKGEKVGRSSQTYSLGASIKIPYAQLDFAYEWKKWQYMDYYSYHVDYITWESANFLAGLTIKL